MQVLLLGVLSHPPGIVAKVRAITQSVEPKLSNMDAEVLPLEKVHCETSLSEDGIVSPNVEDVRFVSWLWGMLRRFSAGGTTSFPESLS